MLGLVLVALTTCCPVVELRQYTALPGKRDDLIRLYEERFIESQEAAGISLPGQFRVTSNPNQFDWLQGFRSMSARLKGFNAFYQGSAWRTYRARVNEELLENGNVLLLQPAHAGSGFPDSGTPRPPIGSTAAPHGVVVATIYYLGANSSARFDRYFEQTIRPVVTRYGARVLATFVTDHSPNNFPKLPVRGDVDVFLWFACYASGTAYRQFETSLTADPRWWAIQGDFALDQMYLPTEIHVLQPTPRSTLRCDR